VLCPHIEALPVFDGGQHEALPINSAQNQARASRSFEQVI
jgi:hypothetical protein